MKNLFNELKNWCPVFKIVAYIYRKEIKMKNERTLKDILLEKTEVVRRMKALEADMVRQLKAKRK